MSNFLQQAFAALGDAAQRPLAFALYILVVVSWGIITWRVRRFRDLMRRLDLLPEADRLKAIESQGIPLPRKGINAEQYLRARAQNLRLAGWGMLALTAIIVLSLAAFVYLNPPPTSVEFAGQVTIDGLPLREATITVVGEGGHWQTDENGAFRGELPSDRSSDSLTVVVQYTADFQESRFDTTVINFAAGALLLRFETPQTHPLEGQVLESGTGVPIAGATITVGTDSAVSDAMGRFSVDVHGDRSQRVEVTVGHPDYVIRTLGLAIAGGHRITLVRRQ